MALEQVAGLRAEPEPSSTSVVGRAGGGEDLG